MIQRLKKLFQGGPDVHDFTAELDAAEAELKRSREEHAHSVNRRIDLEPLITEAREVACMTRATLARNGWTDLLVEQMAGKKQ